MSSEHGDFISEWVALRMRAWSAQREALARCAYALHDGDPTVLTFLDHPDGSTSVASFWPQQHPYPVTPMTAHAPSTPGDPS